MRTIQSAPMNRDERLGGRELPIAVRKVLGDLRGRVDGDVLALGYADNNTVLSIEEGGVLRKWDPQTGRQTETFALSELESCWAFSPNGKLLVSGGHTLSMWNAATGNLLGRRSDIPWLTTIAFSPDGRFIATGHDDHAVRLWNSANGKLIRTLSGHDAEVCALAFNADGGKLASAGEDRLVILWDVEAGEMARTLLGHTDRIDAVAWSPDGERLASAGWDTSVRIWDPETGELLGMLNGQGECVHAIAFAPGGDVLISGDSDFVVRFWDYRNLKELAQLQRHQGVVRQIAFRKDGLQIATGGADRSIQFWNLDASGCNATPLIDEPGPQSQVQAVALSADGLLATLHSEGRLSLWDFESFELQQAIGTRPTVVSIAAGPPGNWAAGSFDGSISLGSVFAKQTIKRWSAHEASARLLAFKPDGAQLATSAGIDGTVKLWSSETGEPLFIIPQAAKHCTVEAIAFHPTEGVLAVAGIDWAGSSDSEGIVALWNLATHKLDRVLDGGASRIAFSADGKFLAAVSTFRSIFIWDVDAGVMIQELTGLEMTTNAIAFDPAGRYLASGSDDCGLRVWDVNNWHLLATFDLETPVKDLAFGPDGHFIITGNGNSTCYVVELGTLPSFS